MNRNIWRVLLASALLGLTACGGGSDSSIPDRTPDSFSFTPVENANPGEFYEASITIVGLGEDESVPAHLGDMTTDFELLINDVEQESHEDRTVRNGDVVAVRLRASDAPNGGVSAKFFAGEPSVSAVFGVTTKADVVSPEVSVHFPFTEFHTDADSIRVRGAVTDDFRVAEVEVNGIAVTSTDAFAHWSAEIPLGGVTEIFVVARDSVGNESRETLQVRGAHEPLGSGETILQVHGMHVDDTHKRLLLTVSEISPPSSTRALLALDILTLARSRLNNGPFAFASPKGVVFDPQSELVFVADTNDKSIKSIDAVGANAYYSVGANHKGGQPQRGAGPDLDRPFGLIRDAESGPCLLRPPFL